MAKGFLLAAGLTYLVFAIWCMWSPKATSEAVGFQRMPGSGESEFFVVYGGLELALALIFLLPWVRPEFLLSSLIACLIVHACLVLTRTISFVLYGPVTTTTYILAAGEWLYLLLAVVSYIRLPNSP